MNCIHGLIDILQLVLAWLVLLINGSILGDVDNFVKVTHVLSS